VIQAIIRHGLDREELRDEIYVQCVRQINNNPSPDQAARLWLLLCLVVVAFPPGKSFFKVKTIFLFYFFSLLSMSFLRLFNKLIIFCWSFLVNLKMSYF
jgi:hypothetical protein